MSVSKMSVLGMSVLERCPYSRDVRSVSERCPYSRDVRIREMSVFERRQRGVCMKKMSVFERCLYRKDVLIKSDCII